MKYNFLILTLLLWVLNLYPTQPKNKCYYLDKSKIENTLKPLILSSTEQITTQQLEKRGLVIGNKLKCRWSLNGGSGIKENFSFDMNVAAPILNPKCEEPFSHIYNGVGFGDWYLTICGRVENNELIVTVDDEEFSINKDSLFQWTEYEPDKFPIAGDHGN